MEDFFLKAAALIEEFMFLLWLLIMVLGVHAFANLMRAWRSKQEQQPLSLPKLQEMIVEAVQTANAPLEARLSQLQDHVEQQDLRLLERPNGEPIDLGQAEDSLVERRSGQG